MAGRSVFNTPSLYYTFFRHVCLSVFDPSFSCVERGLGRALGRGTDWIYFVLEPLAASRDDETMAKVVKEANSLAVIALRVALVHSQINHFRQRKERPRIRAH